MYECCPFIFGVLFFPPLKHEWGWLPSVKILAAAVGFVFGICSCVHSPNNFSFLSCRGRGISAVSLANPAVAVLCLERNWRCVHHHRHGGWFQLALLGGKRRGIAAGLAEIGVGWARITSTHWDGQFMVKLGCLQPHRQGCRGRGITYSWAIPTCVAAQR